MLVQVAWGLPSIKHGEVLRGRVAHLVTLNKGSSAHGEGSPVKRVMYQEIRTGKRWWGN